jgi:prepilin-type N-terminal cleavage/methylation domain-containing protein
MRSFIVRNRRGFSLLEMLVIVAVLGIITAIIVPRISVSSDSAKQKNNANNKATINAAVERYYIENGVWPADNLSDIGAESDYFPNGIPSNPLDGSVYSLDPTTHRVR